MIMGIPMPAFIAFVVQVVMIVLSILYALNYKKLIQKPPFDFFTRLQDEFKDEK